MIPIIYNNCLNCNNTSYDDFEKKQFKEKFYEPFKHILENYIFPVYGKSDYTIDIQLGFWLSDEYGSYRISLKKQGVEFYYITADIIFGEWKGYDCAS